MDLFSRRIIGWSLDDTMEESLVRAALRRAIQQRQPKPGLIHHPDRGGQYAGTQLRAMIDRAGMRQSMSEADDDYGNVFMESCFGTLKRELPMRPYSSRAEAWPELSEYLDHYYNSVRLHSSLGYLSPVAFES